MDDVEIAEEIAPKRIYPLVSERYKVVFIDSIVIIMLAFIYSMLLDGMGNVPIWLKQVCFASCFLYEPLAISFFGGTIGHWSGNLKVVQESDEVSKVPVWRSLLRTVIKYILGILSLFTINHANRGRAIHDEALGSLVLFTNESERLSSVQ